jgi:carboxymethylenebutenolidase
VQEREIRIATSDGDMATFVARPDADGPWPVALLFMDGVGYRDQVKDNARRFAAAGYWVAAPDLFHRAGDRLSFDFTRMGDEAYRQHLMQVVSSVTQDAALRDTEAVLALAADDPAAADGPAVCIGYCMGAKVALHAASALPDTFVAAAGIHPSALVTDAPDSPHHDLATVRGELYFAFAEIDNSATETVVDRFRQELAEQGVEGVVERLSGVAHGFAMADLPVYDQAAAERHFERTLDLWRRNLSAERLGA